MRAPQSVPAAAAPQIPLEQRLFGMVLIAAALLRLGILFATHYTFEDSLITLRYAENLAHGLGFVYNPGQRVLGTTTPLFTLLLALFAKIGLNALELGKLLNVAADTLLSAVVYRWLRAAGAPASALLAAFVIAVNPLQIRWSISGMESSLVALWGMAAWTAWTERRSVVAYALLALLFLLRWDGLLLAAVLTAAHCIRERRFPLRETALFLLLVAPWVLFAWWYFGSPIPVTALAKATVYGWHGANPLFPRPPGLPQRLFGSPVAALGTLAALVGLWRVYAERRTELAAPIVWLSLYGAALCVTPVLLFEWYLVPPFPVFAALAAVGLTELGRRLAARWPERARSFAALGAAYVAVAASGWWSYTLCERGQRVEDRVRKPLGLWLQNASRPTDRVLLEPIGYIGYYSQRPVLDMIGLVSPEVLPFWRSGSPSPPTEIALHFRPEWCVLRPAELEQIRHSPRGLEWQHAYAFVSSYSYLAERGREPVIFRVYRRR